MAERISEAMVEAALAAMDAHRMKHGKREADDWRPAMRSALKAALSAAPASAQMDELSRLREANRKAYDTVKLIELDLALAVGISRGYNLQPALDAARALREALPAPEGGK